MQRFVRWTLFAAVPLAFATHAWVATPQRHPMRPTEVASNLPASTVAAVTQAQASAPGLALETPATRPQASARARSTALVAPPAVVTASAPGEAGMRAFYDPETGTIGAPTLSQAAQVEPASPANWQDLVVEGRATDGSPMIDLKGLMQDYSVLQLTVDGHRVMRCVEDPSALKGFAAPVAKPVEE